MCLDLSEYDNGRGRVSGSSIRQVLRLMLTATDPSSIYFTFSAEEFLKERGRGIGGLRKAPLNLIMKIKPPRKAPWGVPAGRSLGEDSTPSMQVSWFSVSGMMQ